MILWIGCWRPGVFFGGTFDEMAWPLKVYATLCAVGLASLVLNSLWRRVRPAPVSIVRHERRIIDLGEEWRQRIGDLPIGSGRHQSLARLSFNQAFQIDISTRTVHIPHLSEVWDGFTIVQWTDLHLTGTVDRTWFQRVAELTAECDPDLLVCTGDLIDEMSLVSWLPDILGPMHAPVGRLFILGNHDWHQQPERIRDVMVNEAGWTDVASRTVACKADGRQVLVAGNETPWLGDEPEMPETPAPGTDSLRLALSHTPDNFPWAIRQDADLMFAGHNHGGQVCLPLIGPVYSPSRHGVRFASGAFARDGTTMLVSRGLSGRHPLRVLCRPELVRVILKTGASHETMA